jgi:hypothetical protein
LSGSTSKVHDKNELKAIIASHLNQVNNNQSKDTKFFLLWSAFNAFGTYFSKENTDKAMIEWIKTKSPFTTIFQHRYTTKQSFRTDCAGLMALCPIYDMRPNPKDPLFVRNPSNPSEILDAIYRVRCNLFHGFKIIENPRDLELINLSFAILSEVTIPILATV